MTDIICLIPPAYLLIEAATRDAGFTMASDIHACSLLKTLAAAKPAGRFLELGTGTGLSTAWILAGMNQAATLISIDNDPGCLNVAKTYLGHDLRLTLIETDGGEWVADNCGQMFDYIFADTWHGKYLVLTEVLAMNS